MRLIDADVLIDRLNERKNREQGIRNIVDILGVKSFIEEQPTAYDIDKVVEELEKNASRYTKKYITPYGNNGYKDTKAISVHKAIEIVKQGGVGKNAE